MLRKRYGGDNWRNELSSFATEILMQILWEGLCWLLGFVGIFLVVWGGFVALLYFLSLLLVLPCILKLCISFSNYSYLHCLSEILDLPWFLIAHFERRCSSPTSVKVGQRALLGAEDGGRRFIMVGSSKQSKALSHLRGCLRCAQKAIIHTS